MRLQRTLKKALSLSGVGLHSGKATEITLVPAEVGNGLHFVRIDLPGQPLIQAHYKNVVCTQLATTLGHGKVRISTVEHILAACQGLGVDNLRIEVNGPEVPIMDGSAQVFLDAMLSVGLENQHLYQPYLKLKRAVEVIQGNKFIRAEASASQYLEISGRVDFSHPAIGFQSYFYHEAKTPFNELASARTFGFYQEVEQLKKMGLAKGGSLDNAIVLGEKNILNPEGLRMPDEFVKHKVLDALGDFKLLGGSLAARVELHRAGHELHCELLAQILNDERNYEWIRLPEDEQNAKLYAEKESLSFTSSLMRPLAVGI